MLCEDFAAAGFIDVITRESDYRPHYAVPANLELPMRFAAPVMRFNFSVAEMGQKVVAMMLEMLRQPPLHRLMDYVHAVRDGDTPQQ